MARRNNRIRLGHGSGGLLTNRLIKNIILRYFKSPILKLLEDSAQIKSPGTNFAFTTDSYVIDPIFFPGGDIGMLAIYGTVNDLAMKGAIPKYLSFSVIIEEGFAIDKFERIIRSAARAARNAQVQVVCGDTKVVEKGKADSIFITTAGIGVIKIDLAKKRIKPDDVIIVSGTIGDHGVAIMNKRLNLGLRSTIKSDAAPLNLLTRSLLKFRSSIHFMRDPTRGGIVSVLNEMVDGSKMGVIIKEEDVPIKREVIGATDILGIDPLYIANEGKLVCVVEKKAAGKILKTMKSHKLGKDAAVIGKVIKDPGVWLKTRIGGIHPLLQLEAEGLPRIC
jgi:hydrogenase expression/formation protein HypE